MERDAIPLMFSAIPQISTHTLTWSVTFQFVAVYCFANISTHTLTWSVTVTAADTATTAAISTHTLTWSVT